MAGNIPAKIFLIQLLLIILLLHSYLIPSITISYTNISTYFKCLFLSYTNVSKNQGDKRLIFSEYKHLLPFEDQKIAAAPLRVTALV